MLEVKIRDMKLSLVKAYSQLPQDCYNDLRIKWDNLLEVIDADKITAENRENHIVELTQDIEEAEASNRNLTEMIHQKRLYENEKDLASIDGAQASIMMIDGKKVNISGEFKHMGGDKVRIENLKEVEE